MKEEKSKLSKNGISLRTIHTWLVIIAFLLAGLMLYSTFNLSTSFKALTENSENTTELSKAAIELMDASDYMTEKVQRFVITGELHHLQNYYNEAFLMKHREEAINIMTSATHGEVVLDKLQQAMDGSLKLMEREYYAIKLVVEAQGYKSSPLLLDDVTLSEEDEALSPDEKMKRAAEMVFDDQYYSQKYEIRSNMRAGLEELENYANETDAKELENMRLRMNIMRATIVLVTIGIFFLAWLASRLGISPVLRAVERIKNNKTLPEAGSTEFRYLVRAYNQMYEMYRNSIAQLDFKATHDELTGVFNRAGYDSIIESIDIKTTYMLLFDVDNFKSINDTYGHEIGDKVLQKFASALKNNFRPDDFICRIGGDEFVVLMQRTQEMQQSIITEKIERINTELSTVKDGIPGVTISVGIARGSDAQEIDELFKKTDDAMYDAKQKGKSTYAFYSE